MSQNLPTLVHTHGIGEFDYSAMRVDDLEAVDALAADRGVNLLPGAFLVEDYLDELERIIWAYGKEPESFPHIKGFSIEGPMLGTEGGVPPMGIWSPTPSQWERMASLGEHGLSYIVIAPDAGDLEDSYQGVTFREIIDMFYQHGVRIALGHFRRSDPGASARRTTEVIDYVRATYGQRQDLVLTDHLYSDMPRNFKHAWRTPEEQTRRDAEVAEFMATEWEPAITEQLLGPVPAALVEYARDGKILPFLNCDGDHVDVAVCERTIRYVGHHNLIGMTDDTEIGSLAGHDLFQCEGTGLLYRAEGVIAAGTGFLSRQLANIASMDVPGETAEVMFTENPQRMLTPIGG